MPLCMLGHLNDVAYLSKLIFKCAFSQILVIAHHPHPPPPPLHLHIILDPPLIKMLTPEIVNKTE